MITSAMRHRSKSSYRYTFAWHPCGEYFVGGLFERHTGTLLFKISDYLLHDLD